MGIIIIYHLQDFPAHRHVVEGISHAGEFKGHLNQKTKMEYIADNQSLNVVAAFIFYFLASKEIYPFTLPEIPCLCPSCELN